MIPTGHPFYIPLILLLVTHASLFSGRVPSTIAKHELAGWGESEGAYANNIGEGETRFWRRRRQTRTGGGGMWQLGRICL